MRGAHKDMRGFEYLVYSAISLSLLVVLIALPVAPVFAGEEVTEPTAVVEAENTPVPETVADVEEEVIEPLDFVASALDESSTEIEVENDEDTPLDTPPLLEDTTLVVEEEGGTDEIVEEVIDEEMIEEEMSTSSPDTVIEVGDEETQDVTLPDEESATTTEITPPEEEIVEEVPVEDIVPEVEEVEVEEEIVEEVPQGETISVGSVTTDENKFTFSKDECTLAQDGAFYCAKATPEAEIANTDRVFSAPDADGDKEIYVEKDGELFAVTQNTYDDDAPYFDESSNTMVWHRLIDGRYQIISYDFDSQVETQITNDRYNNMQPTQFRDALVWQGWVGNDWEIFLLEDNELTMLTDNTTHDITPSINGTHIVWQSFEGSVWHMKVYDMNTEAITTIEDTDGGSIENLRFVLVYDTKFETGDVETKGYDLKSGEVLSLGVQPVSIPEELPDPEQTGEERALVTPPTQPKTKAEGELDDAEGDTGETPEDPVIVEEEMDIIIPPITNEQGTTTDESALEETVSSSTPDITDVIVTPFVEEIEITTEHILDIIVTPFVEPIIEEELIDSSTL